MPNQFSIGPIKLTLRTQEVKQRVALATFAATQEVFETDIKQKAKEYSPVSETWPSIPESRGEKRIDQGTNRRSIDTDVTQEEGQVKAELYTQSGYGGYLETGTAHMPARPYLYPAFNEGIITIKDKIKEKL